MVSPPLGLGPWGRGKLWLEPSLTILQDKDFIDRMEREMSRWFYVGLGVLIASVWFFVFSFLNPSRDFQDAWEADQKHRQCEYQV